MHVSRRLRLPLLLVAAGAAGARGAGGSAGSAGGTAGGTAGSAAEDSSAVADRTSTPRLTYWTDGPVNGGCSGWGLPYPGFNATLRHAPSCWGNTLALITKHAALIDEIDLSVGFGIYSRYYHIPRVALFPLNHDVVHPRALFPVDYCSTIENKKDPAFGLLLYECSPQVSPTCRRASSTSMSTALPGVALSVCSVSERWI